MVQCLKLILLAVKVTTYAVTKKKKLKNFRIAGIQTLTSALSKTTNNFETVNVEVA